MASFFSQNYVDSQTKIEWFKDLIDVVLIKDFDQKVHFSKILQKAIENIPDFEAQNLLDSCQQFPILQMGLSIVFLPNVPYEFRLNRHLMMEWRNFLRAKLFADRTHPSWVLNDNNDSQRMLVLFAKTASDLFMEFINRQAVIEPIINGSYGEVLVRRLYRDWHEYELFVDLNKFNDMDNFVNQIEALCADLNVRHVFSGFREICCKLVNSEISEVDVCHETYHLFRYHFYFYEILLVFKRFLPHLRILAKYVVDRQ